VLVDPVDSVLHRLLELAQQAGAVGGQDRTETASARLPGAARAQPCRERHRAVEQSSGVTLDAAYVTAAGIAAGPIDQDDVIIRPEGTSRRSGGTVPQSHKVLGIECGHLRAVAAAMTWSTVRPCRGPCRGPAAGSRHNLEAEMARPQAEGVTVTMPLRSEEWANARFRYATPTASSSSSWTGTQAQAGDTSGAVGAGGWRQPEPPPKLISLPSASW
jgi:hypothetical protein